MSTGSRLSLPTPPTMRGVYRPYGLMVLTIDATRSARSPVSSNMACSTRSGCRARWPLEAVELRGDCADAVELHQLAQCFLERGDALRAEAPFDRAVERG